MKILVPVDGSEYATEGLRVASVFGKAATASIYLMNVVPFTEDIDLELSASDREAILAAMDRRGREILQKGKDLLESCGAPYVKTVLSTAPSPAAAIVEFAEKEKIDLIVIGSRGQGATERFIFGSVASKVVLHSPCSVHVVKERGLP